MLHRADIDDRDVDKFLVSAQISIFLVLLDRILEHMLEVSIAFVGLDDRTIVLDLTGVVATVALE